MEPTAQRDTCHPNRPRRPLSSTTATHPRELAHPAQGSRAARPRVRTEAAPHREQVGSGRPVRTPAETSPTVRSLLASGWKARSLSSLESATTAGWSCRRARLSRSGDSPVSTRCVSGRHRRHDRVPSVVCFSGAGVRDTVSAAFLMLDLVPAQACAPLRPAAAARGRGGRGGQHRFRTALISRSECQGIS